ncbi:ribokinase [Parasphingorhabdus pacifica]
MDLVAYAATAPKRGETVAGREFRTIQGGKGANQAIAAARAGATVQMLGAVGSDELGSQLRAGLEGFWVRTDRLRTEPGASGTAHIVVDDEGGNSIVIVPGANGTLDELRAEDERIIAESRILLLQLEIPLRGVESAAAVAKRNGVPVVLTPAPAAELPASLLANVDLLVPNEHEAEVLTGHSEPRRALDALLELVPEVVITLGSEGALYGNRSDESLVIPSYPVRAVDTTAAGDTFVGALGALRVEGADMPESLEVASAASALSVQRNGASSSMPTRREIMDFRSGAFED